jgi:uncharacterized protein
MISKVTLLSIVLGVMLFGCSTPTPAKPPGVTITSEATTPVAQITNQGQVLPISGYAVLPNGTKLELEVARTPQQQAMGLMYRPALPDNRGMLFEFSSPQPVNFWMKNVPVALDMLFLHKGVVKYIAASVPPCAKEPCPTYGPNTLIDQVIELRAGRAAELGLKKGDSIKVSFVDTRESRR